ncbi:MAG TPA: PAS domain S-box protein [Opitutaceae bacterium]|nr:PAS domain S-box protein [Opitutaceae bacterium]
MAIFTSQFAQWIHFATVAQVLTGTRVMAVAAPPPANISWPEWLMGAFGTAIVVTVVALIFNFRLQRKVEQRTRELRASEERHRRLMEQAGDAIFVADAATGLLVEINRATTELLGRSEAEVVGRPHTILYGLEDAAERQRLFVEHARRGGRQEAEVTLLHCDGTSLPVEMRMASVEAGGRRYLQAIMRDLRPRRAAAEALRASEERYRTLFESAVEGVYESTPEGRFRTVNPALARMLGFVNVAEMIAGYEHIARDLYVEPGRRAEFFRALDSNDEVVDFESEVRCRDGSTKWISEDVRAVRDGQGRLLYFQGFISDVTERRRAEAALAAERERLSVMLRAMAESVVTVDTEGVVQFINHAAETLTGWKEGGGVGRKISEVCVLQHEKTRALVAVPVTAALAEDRVIELPPQTALVSREDQPCLIEGRCAPMHDMSGRAVGVVLVFRDVTERARLELEMQRTSKLESVGILAGGIAHDFNNILTVVMGHLALTMIDAQAAGAPVRWLEEAERGVLRARDLTQQLLTFAKGGEPVRAAVRLPEVVQEAAQFALHGSKVRCDFHADPELWPADVDKVQIGQVVQNLVINAVQAMPGGGVISISLRNEAVPAKSGGALAAGDHLKISFVDTGTGIRPELLPRIFEPYFTTKTSGSGLGLATVYSIIKKHYGHIEVESEPGKGTTFNLWLPAAQSRPVEVDAVRSPFEAMPGRVLFMDDEEPIRQMAKVLLTKLGFDVMTAKDGDEVIREYKTADTDGRPFDLVVMDLTVPGGMGGREAIEHLLKLDPEVRAVVSSGYSSDPVLANYRVHGFRGRVTKPYRIAELAKTLRGVMAGVEG